MRVCVCKGEYYRSHLAFRLSLLLRASSPGEAAPSAPDLAANCSEQYPGASASPSLGPDSRPPPAAS